MHKNYVFAEWTLCEPPFGHRHDGAESLSGSLLDLSISFINTNPSTRMATDFPIEIEAVIDDDFLEEAPPSKESKLPASETAGRKGWLIGGAVVASLLVAALAGIPVVLLINRQASSQTASRPSPSSPALPSFVTLHPTFSLSPTAGPSALPSLYPSMEPSLSSALPSLNPSTTSTTQPSGRPSSKPSHLPSTKPSFLPSHSPSKQPSGAPTTGPPVVVETSTFYAIGDVPYTNIQAEELTEQMTNIPTDADFVIHVGDLRSASHNSVCQRSDYTSVSSILRLSRVPVFVVLGDNDWNDCPNISQGWIFWQAEFNSFDGRYWNHTLDVTRQPERTENFSFIHKGTLFIGLNIVGGRVHNSSEWETRLTEQVEWTMGLIREYNSPDRVGSAVVVFAHANPVAGHHDAFFGPFTAFIANELQNQLPILYLNGDKHQWLYEPSFFDQPSFLRIMLTGGTDEPALRVSVVSGDERLDAVDGVFTYNRQL